MNWISFEKKDLFQFPPKPTGQYIIAFKYQYPAVTECSCGYVFHPDDEEWERCFCISGPSESDFCYDILYYRQHENRCSWKSKTYNDMHIKGYPPTAKGYDPNNDEDNDDIKFYYWCEIIDPSVFLDDIGRY